MYLVLESILFVLTEGSSWRAIDRPQARWNSVYQYFRRWCQRGTLQKVLTQFGPELAPGWHFLASITLLSGVIYFLRECRVAIRTMSGRSQQPRPDRFQDLLQRQTRSFFLPPGSWSG